jgi:hypothetical protein
MPSTAQLCALARRDPNAAIRVLDDFGNWLAANVQELVEEKAREDADPYGDDDESAHDDARYWLDRWRPDICREERRLEQFALNVARTTRQPAPLRTAAREHWHWAWSDLDVGLRRRRHERRGAPLRVRGRRRGAGRPRARRARRVRSSSSSSRDEPSDSDEGESDGVALACARRAVA